MYIALFLHILKLIASPSSPTPHQGGFFGQGVDAMLKL